MRRTIANRRTVHVLRRTLAQLEADPTVDTQDTSFVSLKCALLNRILELETDTAHAEAVIHLVESTNEEPLEIQAKEDDSAIA